MNPSKQQARQDEQKREDEERAAEGRNADTQPPATGGANTGSPAAPVMKQFAKTTSESTGRS